MTPEQKAAYVNAQVALLNLRVAGMIATNEYRKMQGNTIAYDEGSFEYVKQQFEASLGNKNLFDFFSDD